MPGYDLAFDYELLNQLADDADRLKNQLGDSRLLGRESFYGKGDLGEVYQAVTRFFWAWMGPWENAQELLESLSGTYKVAAQKMFELDASFAAQANTQAAALYHGAWEMKKKAYEEWKWLTEHSITVHAWDKNGHEYTKQEQLAHPDDPGHPEDPGYEPDRFEYFHDDGDGTDNVHNSTQITYRPDGNPDAIDTTIDDGGGGLKYHEHTDYSEYFESPNGDFETYSSSTTTITHSDGSKTVIDVHADADGKATRHVTDTDKDGNTTSTSSYTGTGLNTHDPKWTNDDPDATDTDGDGKKDKNDPGGSQHSNTGVGSQA